MKFEVSQNTAVLYSERLIAQLQESYSYILSRGYEEIVLEDFYEPLKNIVQNVNMKLKQDIPLHDLTKYLLEMFNDENVSSYYIYYLRAWTVCHLKDNREEYQYSIDMTQYAGFDDYIKKEVESMGSEADMIHVGVMKAVFQVNIDIYYVDASASSGSVNKVFDQMSQMHYSTDYILNVFDDPSIKSDVRADIKQLHTCYLNGTDNKKHIANLYQFQHLETDESMVKLLYRPGHYDVVE